MEVQVAAVLAVRNNTDGTVGSVNTGGGGGAGNGMVLAV
jgi:hypothetical protein